MVRFRFPEFVIKDHTRREERMDVLSENKMITSTDHVIIPTFARN
jgi:hypothetical protein